MSCVCVCCDLWASFPRGLGALLCFLAVPASAALCVDIGRHRECSPACVDKEYTASMQPCRGAPVVGSVVSASCTDDGRHQRTACCAAVGFGAPQDCCCLWFCVAACLGLSQPCSCTMFPVPCLSVLIMSWPHISVVVVCVSVDVTCIHSEQWRCSQALPCCCSSATVRSRRVASCVASFLHCCMLVSPHFLMVLLGDTVHVLPWHWLLCLQITPRHVTSCV
jgi:hypothetical protein